MQKIRVQQPRHAKTLKPNPYWRLPGSAARQAIQSFQSVELLDARAVMRRETFQRALQTAPKAKAAALHVGRIDWESIEESKFHLRSAVHVGKNFWSNTRFGMFGHRFAKQALGWLGNAISKRLSNQFMNQNLDWHCVWRWLFSETDLNMVEAQTKLVNVDMKWWNETNSETTRKPKLKNTMSEIYLHCITSDDLLHNAAPLHHKRTLLATLVLWHRWLSAAFFLPSISALALPVLCSLDCAIWQKHGRKPRHAMLPCATLRLHQLRVCHSSLCLSRLSFSSFTTWLREDSWLRLGFTHRHRVITLQTWGKSWWRETNMKPSHHSRLDGIFGKNIQDLEWLAEFGSQLEWFFDATSCHKACKLYDN